MISTYSNHLSLLLPAYTFRNSWEPSKKSSSCQTWTKHLNYIDQVPRMRAKAEVQIKSTRVKMLHCFQKYIDIDPQILWLVWYWIGSTSYIYPTQTSYNHWFSPIGFHRFAWTKKTENKKKARPRRWKAAGHRASAQMARWKRKQNPFKTPMTIENHRKTIRKKRKIIRKPKTSWLKCS